MQEETRREFLKNTKNYLSLLAFPYIVSAKEGPTKNISHNFKLVSKTVFMPAPAQNVGVHAASCYTDRKKNDLISIHSHTSKSDLNDAAFFRFSSDNGQTWSDAARWYTKFEHPNGIGRRYPGPVLLIRIPINLSFFIIKLCCRMMILWKGCSS